MTFQRALICQQKINNFRLKNNYISSQQRFAPAPSKIKTPVGSKRNQRYSSSVCYITKGADKSAVQEENKRPNSGLIQHTPHEAQ